MTSLQSHGAPAVSKNNDVCVHAGIIVCIENNANNEKDKKKKSLKMEKFI